MTFSLKIRLSIVSPLFLLLCCTSAQAQPGYGSVSFANSGSAAAQSDFLRGLALLHNFEYGPAAEHFRKAEQLFPGFAMAYWGEAMTQNHAVWHEQDLPAARAVLARLGATPEARQAKAPTQREKLYLHSIEVLYGDGTKAERDQKYESAMADLHWKFPEDVDATSFYALAILGSADQGRDFATYMRAAAVLEEIFPQNPRHPGVVHYLIHCYDDPIHAPLGLRAARIYSKIAPAAGHAQHMTSHIFLALGMWDDVVKANETATAVVNRQRQTEAAADVWTLQLLAGVWLPAAGTDRRRAPSTRRMPPGSGTRRCTGGREQGRARSGYDLSRLVFRNADKLPD